MLPHFLIAALAVLPSAQPHVSTSVRPAMTAGAYSFDAVAASWGRYDRPGYQYVTAQRVRATHRSYVQVRIRRLVHHQLRTYTGSARGKAASLRVRGEFKRARVRARVSLRCRSRSGTPCPRIRRARVVATFTATGPLTWVPGGSSELVGRLANASARIAGHRMPAADYAEVGRQSSVD